MPNKQTIAACLIAKNEELTVSRILAQARQCCDEIVLVDTGSTDRTVELAEAAGAVVYHFPWIDDFSAARNFAFSKCLSEWILWVDLDDFLTDQAIFVIKDLANNEKSPLFDPDIRAVWCPYHYQFDPTGKQVTQVLNRERLLRNGVGHRWVGPVHETIEDAWTDSAHCPDLIIEHRTAPENGPRRQGRNLRLLEPFVDPEKSELRWLWLLGAEYSTAARYDDAERVLLAYLRRSEGREDPIGERYAVLLKLAFNALAQQRPEQTKQWAYHLLGQDFSRPEGYALLGIVFNRTNGFAAAWPLLVAAAVCLPPAPQNIVILEPLRTTEPVQELARLLMQAPELQPLSNSLLQLHTVLHNAVNDAKRIKKSA